MTGGSAIGAFVAYALVRLAILAAFRGIRFFNLSVSPLHARLFLVRGIVGALQRSNRRPLCIRQVSRSASVHIGVSSRSQRATLLPVKQALSA